MTYPNFKIFLYALYDKAPFQKKKLEKYLGTKSQLFFDEAEEFSIQYLDYLQSQNIPVDYAIGAYVKMCNEMMKCQVGFMRTGKYPVSLASEALDNVYNDSAAMQSYMIGLALSQYLWSSHYTIFNCFKEALKQNKNNTKSYLEIGPGHGLFLSHAMQTLLSCDKFVAVDISDTSIQITKSIMQHIYPEQAPKIDYYHGDMLDLNLKEKYDFITMGEVIEHVNFPDKLLIKLRDLLSAQGKAFVSTCVDCPAIDHVYHFKSVEEIRQLLGACGLSIINEEICPVEDLPMEEVVRRRITINYCAIVQKADNVKV